MWHISANLFLALKDLAHNYGYCVLDKSIFYLLSHYLCGPFHTDHPLRNPWVKDTAALGSFYGSLLWAILATKRSYTRLCVDV